MSEVTTTTALATTTNDEDGALVLVDTLAHLKEAFDKAHADYSQAEDIRAKAAHTKGVALVWMSRVAYRAMTHPDVASKLHPENITGAAKALGMPVGTLRPYGLAGKVLAKKDLAGLLSEPEEEEITLVNKSFDSTTRAEQKEKRVRAAARKAKLEAKARELDALKAKGAAQAPKAPEGPQAPAGDEQAPAGDKAPQAPASGAQAPAKAPEGPSLQDDALTTAKDLVRKLKALKAAGDKATILKVNAVLADFYPALKA